MSIVRMLRHAVLACGLVLAALDTAHAAAAPLIRAEIPHWRAVLFDGYPKGRDPVPHLRVSHAGRVVLDADLPRVAAWRSPHLVRLIDDGAYHRVVVWADATFEGRETSTVSVLYTFAPSGAFAKRFVYDWGTAGYEPIRVAGTTIYRTADTNFYGLFDARAFSVMPLQLRALREGGIDDVTGDYPAIVGADADAAAKAFAADCERIEILGAYLAEMVRAHRTAEGLREVTRHLHAADERTFFRVETGTLQREGVLGNGVRLAAAPDVARCDAPSPLPTVSAGP